MVQIAKLHLLPTSVEYFFCHAFMRRRFVVVIIHSAESPSEPAGARTNAHSLLALVQFGRTYVAQLPPPL